MTSLLNPHDIALWGDSTINSPLYYLKQQIENSNVPDEVFEPTQWEQIKNDDITKKPAAQASYRATYPKSFQTVTNNSDYHRFYYALQENVDKHVLSVLKTLMSRKHAWRDTIVIYIADHGDQLGAHGSLYQKWHQAYDQTVRTPFIVHNPVLFPKPKTTDVLTSHADLLPTMLGLAGLSEKKLRAKLSETHSEVRKLPGRDLSGFILGEKSESSVDEPVFFMTEDEPTRGTNQMDADGNYYKAVVQPCHIEAVIAKLPTGANGALEKWKYVRYWDNPAFWSNPFRSDVVTFIDGNSVTPGTYSATVTVKVPAAQQTADTIAPPSDEFELYNVTADPLELTNLYGNATYADTQEKMAAYLKHVQVHMRVVPKAAGKLDIQPAGRANSLPPMRPVLYGNAKV